MKDITSLFQSYSELATSVLPFDEPSHEDFQRADEILGFELPKEFVLFLITFYNRHPPFWEVLRVPSRQHIEFGDDITEVNKFFRAQHRRSLHSSVLFRDIGTGDYECFIYSDSHRFLGVGLWEQYSAPEEEPIILFDSFQSWFADAIANLRQR
jgi:hypothetical protein